MKASLSNLPSIGSRAEIEQGMAGMRPDLYQRMHPILVKSIETFWTKVMPRFR